MATTFLELTNRVLRRLNEVELTLDNFASVRGIHATVKDAVADAVERINKDQYKWPFNAYEHTQTLTVGSEEYAWPADFKTVDWNSFQIQKDEDLNVNHRRLIKWNRDEWYRLARDTDQDAGTSGLGVPSYVSSSHGTGFALSPSPDKAYSLKFRYFVHPSRLALYTDTSTIPSQFDYVIQEAAMVTVYDFLEDTERSVKAEQNYRDYIKQMRSILINDYDHITDTRVNF